MALLRNVTYDDFAFAFEYGSGNWTMPDTSAVGYADGNQYLSSLLDATYHSTTVPGSSVTLSFEGAAVYLYGASNGSYLVSLDGQTAAQQTAVPVTTGSSLLWSSSALEYGQHTVTVSKPASDTSATHLLVDYALVTASFGAAGATLTNTTIDNLDTNRLVYSGSFTSNNDSRFHDGTSTYTNGDGASISLRFNGSAVYVLGDTVDDHGPVDITLDGETVQYNGYTPYLKFDSLMFFKGNLNATEHTLVITNRPGVIRGLPTFVDLDWIEVTVPSAYYDATAASSSSVGPSSTSTSAAAGGTSPSATSSGTPSAPAAATTTAGAGRRAISAIYPVVALLLTVVALF